MGSKQKGFGTVEVIIIIVVIAVIGFIGWRVYDSRQDTTTTSAESTSDTKETPTDKTVTPAQSDSTEAAKVEFAITKWDVTIADTMGLTGLVHTTMEDPATVPTQLTFTTQELKDLNGTCDGDVSYATLGIISRSTNELATADTHTLVKKIGDYYYYYYAPQTDCGPAATDAKQAEQMAKFKEAINTLKAIE